MPQLWQGRASKAVDSRVNDFNSSIRFDARMIEQDIQGSLVHSAMLGRQGIISQQDVDDIHKGLHSILEDLHSGALEIDPNAEDVHTFVEQTLTARVGDAGKRLHTGRSRNDQVALDIRLNLREASKHIQGQIKELITVLCDQAEKGAGYVMPGYTHLQRAQPVTFGHQLMAYAWMLLRDLGYRLEAVHCNFQLRGDEADRDEDFCQSLCDELAIPLHRAHFDTRAYAQLHGISIEMAARQLRYAYFRQLREAIGAEAICVAHHRDDSVETILLNLIRGTGIHGLTGMKPRQGDVVRPLLCVSRADLVSYLDGLGRSYVTDSSNLVADVKRNKVRLQILPMIEAINPSFRDTVLTMAAELEGIEQVVDTQLAHYAEATELSIEAIQQEPSAELALYYFLQPRHFNPSQIRQIADRLAASSGSRWISPTHELLSDRGRLTIHPLEADAPRPMRIPETGRYSYANEVTIRLSRAERDDRFVLPTSPETVALDADKVRFPLIIRRTQPGDRFVPLGMKGGKLVSDFLTDQKKSVWEKRHQVVVCDAENQILWIVGNRIDHRVRITDSTRRILLIEKLS